MDRKVTLKRRAQAIWKGSGMNGQGHLSTQSRALENQPYSFGTRFADKDGKSGTNPEELIAAAHAGCFNMALSFQLGGAGFTPKQLNTEAKLIMEKVDGHFEINEITLHLEAEIEGIDHDTFLRIAENAKKTCPVSQALKAIDISLKIKGLNT